MTDMPAMMLWTDAYLADTAHLTTAEHGAYLLILMSMWRAGGTLPNDEKRLARLAKMPLNKWRAVAPTILEFMDVGPDEITQKRLRSELKIATDKREKNRLNGRAGGVAKASKNNDEALANASETPMAKTRQGSTIPEPPSEPLRDNLPTLYPEPARTPAATDASKSVLVGLKKGIVQAFAQAGSMTLAIDTHRAAIWIEQGFRPGLILSVITAELARKPHVRNLAYFDNAIADAHAKAAPPPALAPDTPKPVLVHCGGHFPIPESFVIEAVDHWRRDPSDWDDKFKDRFGPAPDHESTFIPAKYREGIATRSRKRSA